MFNRSESSNFSCSYWNAFSHLLVNLAYNWLTSRNYHPCYDHRHRNLCCCWSINLLRDSLHLVWYSTWQLGFQINYFWDLDEVSTIYFCHYRQYHRSLFRTLKVYRPTYPYWELNKAHRACRQESRRKCNRALL